MSQTAAARNQLPARAPAAFVAYLSVVVTIGVGVLAWVLAAMDGSLVDVAALPGFWIVLALVVVGEVRPLFVPGVDDPGGVAISTPFAFAALLAFGLPSAALMHVAGSVATGLLRRQAWWRTAFNAAQYTLSLAAAQLVLRLGSYPASTASPYAPDGRDIPLILAAIVAYFVVNDVLVTVAVALQAHTRIIATILDDLAVQAFITVAAAGLSPVIALAMVTRPWLLLLVILPVAALYSNASVSVAREREARRDGLTGLANRAVLVARTVQAISVRGAASPPVALLVMDLDRFKEVNDTLGHPAGDRVLQIVAERIRTACRPQDVVARLGGDEFAVLLPAVGHTTEAIAVARRIRASLLAPVHVDEVDLDLDVSIGIAMHPEHGATFAALHQRADVALYLAKAGVERVAVYDPRRDHNTPQRLGMVAALRQAVARAELEVHYQPRLHLADGQVSGLEALVRWYQPSWGSVPPAEFLPLAERAGLMPAVTELVLRRALTQLEEWRAHGLHVPLSVNVSQRDLVDPRFVDRVLTQLERHRIPPWALTLEVTERACGVEGGRGAETLRRARSAGLGVSLRDFGTGHSSLTMLARFPVSEIKIDRSFVSRMGPAAVDTTIARALVDLAHALNLPVVAEGVEDAAALESLAAMGCDEAEGWVVARPMDADATTTWLTGRTLRPVRRPDRQPESAP